MCMWCAEAGTDRSYSEAFEIGHYSRTSLIRTLWDRGVFRLVKVRFTERHKFFNIWSCYIVFFAAIF